MSQAGTETANRERVGDFYVYPLRERTTIANSQTKQVSFLDVSGAPAARGYEYRNDWLHTTEQPESANSVLRFSSSRDQGLGDALPAGTVRVYQRDARGNPQFVGESRIDHTPMGSQIGLTTGQAFDVKVRPVVEGRDRITVAQWLTTARFRIKAPDGTQLTGERDSLRRDHPVADAHALHADQRQARSRSRSISTSPVSTITGTTAGSSSKPCLRSGCRRTRSSGMSPFPPTARRSSTPPSRPGADPMKWWPFAAALSAIVLPAAPAAAPRLRPSSIRPVRNGWRSRSTAIRIGRRSAAHPRWLNGYALISETRQIAVPAGESEIRFEGVAAGIVPQSVIVTGFPEGIVERNRDADLLSPATLLDRSLGRRVMIRRTSLATGAVREVEAVIRSGADGAVVLQTAEGFEALRCTGLPRR